MSKKDISNIIKTVVNKNKAYNQNNIYGPSYSAYVTYSKPSEASIAILSLDNTKIDNHVIRASFGTTKYCSYYLKGIECSNKECLFLHKKADENDIIKRGDLTSNKIIFLHLNYSKKSFFCVGFEKTFFRPKHRPTSFL